MLDINLALIARLGRVASPGAGTPMEGNELLSWVSDLSDLGYAASDGLLKSVASNAKAGAEILNALQVHARAHVDYKPLHGDFAKFMTEASDLEVYVSAIFHYISVYYNMPELDTKTDATAHRIRRATSLAVLEGASKNEAADLAREIITQGQPFSETDLEHVKVFAALIPANSVEVSIHENLAALAAIDPAWVYQMTTVTDVLRLAVALSGGHPSLAANERIRLRRPERRLIANTLGRILQGNSENHEDFARFPEMWKRLASTAHLRDYGHPAVNRALAVIYNESAHTFSSRVEAAKGQSTVAAAQLLASRPGDFARQLMELVRNVETPAARDLIVDEFARVAPQVSLRVLIQLYDYVRGPKSDELKVTPLFTKNSAGGAIPNKREGDYEDVLEAIREGFRNRLSARTFNVNLELAKQYAIPMGVRTASESNRIIGRGSRLRLDADTEFIRLFMHWKNGDGRVDLDLSGVFISEDLQNVENIWYGGLRNGDRSIYHSGDIVDAPNGAAEFIDVPLQMTDSGMRYVALTVYSYTGQKLANVPEAWAGVMQRQNVNSGEHFEAADVALRGDLTSESTTAMPLIVDLKEREVIWVDRDLRGQPVGGNVLNSRPDLLLHDAILQPRTTVAELLDLTGANVSEDGDDLDPVRAEQVLNLLI